MKDKLGLFNTDFSVRFTFFHFILGLTVLFTNILIIVWIILTFSYLLYAILKGGRQETWKLVFTLAYISGIEILTRIAKTSPFLPYEFGKYAFVLLLLVGMFKFKTNLNSAGLWIIILSIPGLLFIPTHAYRDLLVNSFLGIFLLGWASHLLNARTLDPNQLKLIFLGFSYGIVAVTGAVFIRTPSLSEISFELGANFQTAGGFGSNQVSTVFGAGFMITALAFLFKMKLFPWRLANLGLTLVFVFRSLLTFSRGGVLGGLLALLLAYLVPGSSSRIRTVKVQYVIIIFIVLIGAFYIVNEITGNAILDRYKGETYATKIGVREIDAQTLTSGRLELMETELKMFAEKPLFGFGPGGGFDYRDKLSDYSNASHTEATRLLGEHGIPGVLIAIIFLFFPIIRVFKLSTKRERTLVTAFFTIAIFSSFHASMRTTITPFFWALGCMRFPEKSKIADPNLS